MNRTFKQLTSTLALVTLIYIVVPPSISVAASKVNLLTASPFGVLAPTITNTGPTVISGTAGNEYGGFGGPAPTGFGGVGNGTAGTLHNNDAIASGALLNAGSAYGAALSQISTPHVLTPGLTLLPGAYGIGTLASLSGTLTLNGNGDPDAIFVFTAPDSLTTASGSSIILTNGAQACNVFWQITSSASLGTNSTFVGHIVALASITATTGALIQGSLIARTGTVTLDSNTIVNNACSPSGVSVPVGAVQTSRVDSVTPAACVTSGPTTVTINGSFPEKITSLSVNGVSVLAGTWVQTPTSVVITTTPVTTGPVVIQLYNGSSPLLAVQSFICSPAAGTVIVPVVIPAVPTVVTGTIHVIKVVNNTYGGTATAGDFTLWLRHHGTDVVGSPAVGVGGVGRTYILAPGTYVLGEVDSATFPNYIQHFDISGTTSQSIVLAAGQDLTVTQTNTELPPLGAPVVSTTTTPTAPTPPATETGGVLPKTSSPWFNLLLIGVGVMLVSGVVLGLKRSPKI